MNLGTFLRGAFSLALLALASCEEAPEVTVESECRIREWLLRLSHEPPSGWGLLPLLCIPDAAAASDGTIQCRGFLRVPAEELPEGCVSLGLDLWSSSVEEQVCVLPWALGDEEPPEYGFVFDASQECAEKGDAPWAPRLTPLPFDPPGRSELRCQLTDDAACPFE